MVVWEWLPCVWCAGVVFWEWLLGCGDLGLVVWGGSLRVAFWGVVVWGYRLPPLVHTWDSAQLRIYNGYSVGPATDYASHTFTHMIGSHHHDGWVYICVAYPIDHHRHTPYPTRNTSGYRHLTYVIHILICWFMLRHHSCALGLISYNMCHDIFLLMYGSHPCLHTVITT